jgi:EAL domain-containing protein (putative c-di-GMP-specific phosphodiesterase class I)
VRERGFEQPLHSPEHGDGTLIGAAALLRWRHPQRGLVMPASFIPLAEESGLIVPMGEWVLRETCMLIARLDTEGRGLRIAVNVSPRQFHQADFVQRIRDILATTGADPTYLTLEITENLLIEHASESVARMTELVALGLRFSIDDFGTGYSSLAYLKRLPLSELKIDMSFVQDIPHDPNDVALVETILSMAHHLHFEVVAEGVENEAQLAFLRQQGCERFQGYYFHRPLEMRAWIEQLPPAA